MGRVISLITALALLLPAGCTAGAPAEGTPVTVYAPEKTGDKLLLAERTEICPDGQPLWEFALEAVLHGGSTPFPSGTAVERASLDNGVVHVALSAEAAALSGLSLTLARACAVLTLTGLDGIDAVSLSAEGQPALLLRAGDFILEELVLTGAEHSVTLYFSDAEGERTAVVTRTLIVRETDTADRYLNFILEELIAGPKTQGLRPVFPEGTKLLSVIVVGSDCSINLSGEFTLFGDEGSAHMTLSCLVRSVTAQPGITSLSLMVDGQALDDYFGVDLSKPLTLECDWILD